MLREPLSEAARLTALLSYGVLDSASEQDFDDLVKAAADVSGCPVALVGLLDADRQWFKACVGLDSTEAPRELTFCEHALRDDAVLIVPDATADPRFADNPFVTAPSGVRFYAGFPLRTPAGAVLGTLCVVDTVARPDGLTPAQARVLAVLADQVVAQLELRRAVAERDAGMRELATRLQRYRTVADSATDVISHHSPDGTTLYVSPSIAVVLGYDPKAEVGRSAPDRVHPDDGQKMGAALQTAMGGAPASVTVRSRHADGTWRQLEVRLSPVRDDAGQVIELQAVARDVGERVRAQELLETARSEAVQRHVLTDTVLDTVSVGIVACDADGHLTIFNRATREFHGLDPDPAADPGELAGRYALFAEDGVTPLEPAQIPLLRALREGAVEGVTMTISPEGLPARLVRCDGRAMYGPDGTLLGAVVVMTDTTQARADARALAVQADFNAALLETAQSGIWACDTTGRPTYVNRLGRDFYGWAQDVALDVLLDNGAELLPQGMQVLRADGFEVPHAEIPIMRALTGAAVDDELVVHLPDRPRRTLMVHAMPLHDADGEVTGAIATGHDVTALRASEARFRSAFLDGPTPLAHLNEGGRIEEVNPALRRLTGRRTSALLGRDLARLVHPHDADALAHTLTGRGTGTRPVEVRVLRVDGSAVWCELATTMSTNIDGTCGVLVQLLDVDARKEQELRLEHAAAQDPLTGLGNRAGLLQRTQALIDGGQGGAIGALFLDLDGFKAVNDRHGHDAGDAVLVEVAERLRAGTRPGDVVVRLGGDEFVAVCALPGQEAGATLSALVRRVEHAVRAPVPFRGKQLSIGVSVGQAVATAGQSAAALLEAADRDMYRIKHMDRLPLPR